jgi:hypothetical protein
MFLFLSAIWLLYVRILPEESTLILFTVLAFKLNIEYLVPVLAGLYFNITSIVAITIGIFIWNFITTVVLTASPYSGTLTEIVDNIAATYTEVFTGIHLQSPWVFISIIFIMQVIVVNLIKKLEVSYAREIAVIFTMVLNILMFIIGIVLFNIDKSIFSIISWTIISYLIIAAICFMDVVLDYENVRKVKFEDEKNYYYVKIIPKTYVDK